MGRNEIFDFSEKSYEKFISMGVTHIISVCDTFNYEDYPVYVYEGQNVDIKRKKYDGQNMQRVNEIIPIYDPTVKGGIKFQIAEKVANKILNSDKPEPIVQDLGKPMLELVLLCILNKRNEGERNAG